MISVIICSHNPRREYLQRTLAALQRQVLGREAWELLLVDNASTEPLAAFCALDWHPRGRHIRENRLGLTAARIRGIQESVGDLLIFVDDDNLLDPDFLANAQRIAEGFLQMGVFGGRIDPEFEQPPRPEVSPYLTMLALRSFGHDLWSNDPGRLGTYPCGAGLCVRRAVAERYMSAVKNDARRLVMDRRGKQLASGGDDDIVFTAADMHLGAGQFVCLHLTHLIPSFRLTDDYFVRLYGEIVRSGYILNFLRQNPTHRPPKRNFGWWFNFLRCSVRLHGITRRIFFAGVRAEASAREAIELLEAEGSSEKQVETAGPAQQAATRGEKKDHV